MISGRKAGTSVRAFFAVALPEPTREACHALARRLRAAPGGDGVRWVDPASYHVTLRFLGNVEGERLVDLTERVAAEVGGHPSFDVHLGAATVLPSRRNPRVVVVSAEPEAPLAALAGAVEAGVVATGHPPERRAFRAHLTLGRVRNRRIPPLEEAVVRGPTQVPVEEVVLYRSDLRPSGAVYTVLDRISLGARSHEASANSP